LKKNLDFELRAIFTAYKGLKWSHARNG